MEMIPAKLRVLPNNRQGWQMTPPPVFAHQYYGTRKGSVACGRRLVATLGGICGNAKALDAGTGDRIFLEQRHKSAGEHAARPD
jgi:hypothetical protein